MNPLRAMHVLSQVRGTTRRLDDRVRDATRVGIDAGVLDEQSAVDAELADRRGMPWHRPCSSLRIDVMSAVEASRGRRARRRNASAPRLARWGVAAVAAAACLALIGGPWRLGSPSARPDTSGSGEQALSIMEIAFDGGLDGELDIRPVLSDRMEEPLRREARALREDTTRAAGVLMDGLTLEALADPSPR
jgi:hypothetical protein